VRVGINGNVKGGCRESTGQGERGEAKGRRTGEKGRGLEIQTGGNG
jgi:hypothetical protein